MAAQAKIQRDRAELDLRLQIDNLQEATANAPTNQRKIKMEIKKTEDKMQALKYIHANYCKAAGMLPGSTDSMSYINPINTLFQNAMDEAKEVAGTDEEATGPVQSAYIPHTRRVHAS